MEITLATAIVGLGVSILTELIKLVPAIGQSSALKSLVAIIIIAILAFLTNSMEWSWVSFYAVMAFAFVNYKMLVQPVAKAIHLRTQE
jgi:hypothetical protein